MIFTWELHIIGRVQGVGFRPFINRIAVENNIKGEVQNRGNFVKIIAQGNNDQLKNFQDQIETKKPPLAVIEDLEKTVMESNNNFKTFTIIKSQKDSSKTTTGYIPPDISICNECLYDMINGDRPDRKNYAFTSCVDCGPRFSVIKDLPYDRRNTTMDKFPFCPTCYKEYTDPINRRFHAQTTCCRLCGPQYQVYDNTGKNLNLKESVIVKFCQNKLIEGKMGIYPLLCFACHKEDLL